MTQNKQPMSLEDLPKHLQSMREKGEMRSGGAPVVSTGNIVVPKQTSNKTNILAALAFTLFLAIGGFAVYNYTTPSQLTVMVEADPGVDVRSIASIVSESGGDVIAVKKNEDSTYEVKVSTHRKGKFLQRLRERMRIRKSP